MLQASLTGEVGALSVRVELAIEPGPQLLIGPNGSGKTSVLLMLLGVLPVREGRVALSGDSLLDTSRGIDVPVERRGISYVPQDYGLFPHLNVAQNLAFPLSGDRAIAERVAAALSEFGLTELARRSVRELSGGERQSVALARALIAESRALLLDEPLSALDVGARRRVRRRLVDELRRLALPSLIVTHDLADALEFDAPVVVLESGKVVQRGRLDELRAHPATEFVAEFTALTRT